MNRPAFGDTAVSTAIPGLSNESRKVLVLNASLRLVFLSLFLLFPFHEAFYHFVLKGRIQVGANLFYPEHLLLLCLAIAFRRELVRAWTKWRLEMLLLTLYTASFWISSILNSVSLDYAFQIFLTSIVLPALLLLLLTNAVESLRFSLVNDCLLFLFTGVTVICAIGLAAYPASFGIPQDFHQFVYDFRTGLALEGIRAGVWYGDLTAGNFNVFASYLLPAAFLVWGWFVSSSEKRPRLSLAVSLLLLVVAVNLYICYSRGSILVLNACAGLFVVVAWSFVTRSRRVILLAAGVFAFDLLVIAPPGAVTYWTSATHRQQGNSVLQRFEQWEDVAAEAFSGGRRGRELGAGLIRAPNHPTKQRSTAWRVLFGRGIGNYGISRGLSRAANTHNLFLNQYVATGLPGFLAFACLFMLTLVRGWRAIRAGGGARQAIRLGGLAGLMTIALMGVVTQYEFSYLGTITGGALFWTCVFVSRWDGGSGVVSLKEHGAFEKKRFEPATVFALSAYPVSTELLEAWGLEGVRPTLLSELRQTGMRGLVRNLWQIRSEQGVAVIADRESEVFAPILLSLLFFTRCHHLGIAEPLGKVRAVSRWNAVRSFGEILSGTLRGSLAVVRQYAVCARLQVSRRSRAKSSSAEEGWAYLRSSLWFGLKAGGSVGHVAGIVNALHRRRVQLTLMDAERPPMVSAEVPFLGLPTVRRLGFPYELNNYRLDRIVTNFLLRKPISPRPSVLYQRLTLGSISGAVLSRKWGSALVLEYNGSEAWIARRWGRGLKLYGLARLCETVSLFHAHAIVVVSEVLKEECVSRGIPSGRVIVLPNGIDPAIFDPGRFPPELIEATRARLDIPAGAVVLTFLGTYGMWHGAEVFAAAARRLITEKVTGEEGRPLIYLFVGDGLRMADVRAQFADLRPPLPVRYTGLVPQDRAAEYLAASDILVSPHVGNPDGTRFFGSPTKLFEYMAMGKAIAASDLEQIGQVLATSYRASALPEDPPPDGDERLAVLNKPGDLDELVRSLRFLASRPGYRRVLGKNARREALSRYTWEAAVENLLQTLPRAFQS